MQFVFCSTSFELFISNNAFGVDLHRLHRGKRLQLLQFLMESKADENTRKSDIKCNTVWSMNKLMVCIFG